MGCCRFPCQTLFRHNQPGQDDDASSEQSETSGEGRYSMEMWSKDGEQIMGANGSATELVIVAAFRDLRAEKEKALQQAEQNAMAQGRGSKAKARLSTTVPIRMKKEERLVVQPDPAQASPPHAEAAAAAQPRAARQPKASPSKIGAIKSALKLRFRHIGEALLFFSEDEQGRSLNHCSCCFGSALCCASLRPADLRHGCFQGWYLHAILQRG
eukprot:3440444-Rhodomonas_salina.2